MADDAGSDGGATGDKVADPPAAGAESAASDGTGSASPVLFLAGLVAFLGSVVAFVADLVTGHDVLRSLGINAASAVVLVAWAAADTLGDPDSEVTSLRGAAGTGLLLLGLYLLGASVVVLATSPVHDRFDLLPWLAGLAVASIVTGYVVFPRERVLDAVDVSGDESGR